MVALQVWTSWSIFKSLGEFGWFYGDFFLLHAPHGPGDAPQDACTPGLTYAGIYRYLNNPEKIVGQAGYWGLALISYDWRVALLAGLAMGTNCIFLECVEKPHMRRIYGEQLRRESGVSKTVRRIVPAAEAVDQAAGRVATAMELPVARIVHNVKDLFQDARQFLSHRIDRPDGSRPAHPPEDARLRITVPRRDFSLATPVEYKIEGGDGDDGAAGLELGLGLWCWDTGKITLCACTISGVVPAADVPWTAGEYSICVLEGERVVQKSNRFTITAEPALHPSKEDVSARIDALAGAFAGSAADWPRCVAAAGAGEKLFIRFSEGIKTLYRVDFAPATVWQFSDTLDLLADKVHTAATILQ